MGEAKHTPGPWKISHSDFQTNEGQRAILQDIDDAKHIAFITCQSDFKRGKGWCADCSERDANARLIAAAPELLAALEVACSYLDHVDGGNENTKKQIAYWNNLIAKVTGKEAA